jgi:hypothetical protein
MEATMLPSPLPTRQLFSAGARSVDARTNPTRADVTGRQNGNAIDNDCTTININITSTLHHTTYVMAEASNLKVARRACEKMWLDVGILTGTTLSTDHYTRSAYGYTVVFATKTIHINQGRIALIFTNNSLYFQVKAQRKHGGPNVISFIIITGKRQFPAIGVIVLQANQLSSLASSTSTYKLQHQAIVTPRLCCY